MCHPSADPTHPGHSWGSPLCTSDVETSVAAVAADATREPSPQPPLPPPKNVETREPRPPWPQSTQRTIRQKETLKITSCTSTTQSRSCHFLRESHEATHDTVHGRIIWVTQMENLREGRRWKIEIEDSDGSRRSKIKMGDWTQPEPVKPAK